MLELRNFKEMENLFEQFGNDDYTICYYVVNITNAEVDKTLKEVIKESSFNCIHRTLGELTTIKNDLMKYYADAKKEGLLKGEEETEINVLGACAEMYCLKLLRSNIKTLITNIALDYISNYGYCDAEEFVDITELENDWLYDYDADCTTLSILRNVDSYMEYVIYQNAEEEEEE